MELTIEQALQQGVTAHKERKLQDAERLYRAILQSQPAHADANHNLGVLAVSVNKADVALPLFKTALEANPKIEQFWLSYIVALIKEQQFDNAKQVLEQAKRQGMAGEKLISLEAQLSSKNRNPNTTTVSPPQELLNSLLGHYQNGRFNDAERLATSISHEFPSHNFSWKVLGAVLRARGRTFEAVNANQTAVALSPKDAEAHSNLGVTLDDLGRLDEALASYNQAISLKPELADAHLNLCELLEKMNRTDEILSVIRSASGKIFENTADFLYYEVLTEFRKENYETAGELLKKLNINEVLEKRQPAAMKIQGDLYHYNKDYSAAFEAYKLQNKHVKDSPEYKRQDPENYFIQQRKKVLQIEQLQEQTAYKSEIKPSWVQPTFLIGFPRSGTTLLDTILRTHSNIDVLEELPMVNKMNASFGEIPTISKIEAMDNASAEIVSGFYSEELKKHIEVGKNQTLVDKYPLHILELPLINQVFPNARYIIALRHPLDCVLSCWMQNFKLNPAMANMVDLKRIADFYDIAMRILKLSKERYSLETHRIRYEDLVLDFEGKVTSLLNFLGLEWEEELGNYQKTALAREKINTPSSSQVIKPLYEAASYRWKNYEEFLEPYKSRLAPWIKEYGYSS